MSEQVEEFKAALFTSAASSLSLGGLGIVMADPMNRRLIESASIHLELISQILEPNGLATAKLAKFELVVADESVALKLRQNLLEREHRSLGAAPAIVAVRSEGETVRQDTIGSTDESFDGILTLPMSPGLIATQLSLILYKHRACGCCCQSGLEQLQLNRSIFRSVTCGITVADISAPDMPLIYVNPAFEAMTGYSLEESVGKNCRFLQGSESHQPGVTLVRQAMSDEHELTVVLKNFRKDGSSFWNELSLSPIRNREGIVTHVVGIQRDVTARVEFEAALRESEKLAAVGRLSSSIAHEINNPLESVMNLLYLAQREEELPAIMSYLVQADQQVQRVALITSQSLRFYRQSSKCQPVPCQALLETVLDLYERRAENSHVSIERRERSRESVICLDSEIRQVLNNLVRNAIEAMKTGGRLLIRSRDSINWRTGERGVVVTIADTGTGISRQVTQQLYKPFFTTKGAAGTGLGLWISSEIVVRHQGALQVRSSQRPGHSGTVFTLFLPLHGPNAEAKLSSGEPPATHASRPNVC